MLPDSNIKLRPFEMADARRVAELVGDQAVSKWTSNIPFPYSEQDAKDWITSTASDPTKYPFAVELNGLLVACVSYWPHDQNGVEVGYWVGKAFWGRGICTKALSMLMSSEGFPAKAAVFGKVMAQNIGSQRVLEKCGFSFSNRGVIVKGGREIEANFYVRSTAT
jgi:RimJ/RimL family protein N-acetyltransferase